jgi:hypothetical protein
MHVRRVVKGFGGFAAFTSGVPVLQVASDSCLVSGILTVDGLPAGPFARAAFMDLRVID